MYRSILRRMAPLAPFFLIGPISGPLVAGVVFAFRDQRPFLGLLYVAALIEYCLLLPAVVVKMSLHLF